MSDKVRMNVARCTGVAGYYVMSFRELVKDDYGDFNDNCDGENVIHPKDFHKMFTLRLRKGQGPVIVEFPKIEMKVVKK